ncbi:3'-5' exoribonuclease [Sphingobium boeckii]|uniref:Uncharacterized protein n=1 Tax=Sphingobium boeckii TaxID=1082345 RepID=A0A7W9AIS9_9SPHN|nr:3'-5' exoribonuclease [Sphingobium boeckii]MBB5686415.1 hypothetical protein [Sphingobium boeckii]
MRYFLDTEFNGFGGELISIALAPEYGDQEYYAVLPLPEKIEPWVDRHVIPYLHTVPDTMDNRIDAETAAHEIAAFLAGDSEPVIVADWPEDIALFCRLLMTGPGHIVDVGPLTFRFHRSPGFSTAGNSRVPHNALHDARALRDFVLNEISAD